MELESHRETVEKLEKELGEMYCENTCLKEELKDLKVELAEAMITIARLRRQGE